MLSRSLLGSSARALRSAAVAAPRIAVPASAFHTSRVLREQKKPPSPPPGAFARTDDSITVEYPDELPAARPIQGRGGQHMKRTLASFSLENKVCVVTGGARGLGLVMGQGMVISGANLAIVDMNSKPHRHIPNNFTRVSSRRFGPDRDTSPRFTKSFLHPPHACAPFLLFPFLPISSRLL